MKKHLILIMFAIVASVSTTSAAITVRLDPQSCSSWSTVRLWAWTSAGNVFNAWPGKIVSTDTDGWYAYTFDESITEVSIIWNNGSAQTVDITGITASTCYALNSTSGTAITVQVVDCPTSVTPDPDPQPQTIYHVQIGSLYYNLDGTNRTAEVTAEGLWENNYAGLTSVNIPSSVTYNSYTYSVTSIRCEAFSYCSSLTSVTIGNSVTSIGYEAFSYCSSLTSVTIPNSVTSIDYGAFADCSSLTTVTIGNSVTSIGYEAFSYCSSLTSVTIPNSVTSIGDYAFRECSSLTSVTIGNSVIVGSAFEGCSSLTSVVWNAKNGADYEWYEEYDNTPFSSFRSQITSFVFGDEVEHIPAYLCYGMNNLTSVTIPNSVTSIGDYAFRECSSLTSPIYNEHVFAFLPTSYSGDYSIPEGIESIAGGAFDGCSSLTSATIPNSVTSIGEQAFAYCSSLTSVTIPNSVTSIGCYAFGGCISLRTIYVESSDPAELVCTDIYPWEDVFPSYENLVFYVPCGSVGAYEATWGRNYHGYFYWEYGGITRDRFREPELPYKLACYVNDEGMGNVSYPKSNCEMIISATPYDGYYFFQWADGNTDNPRVIELTQDTSYTAIFALNPHVTYVYDRNMGWVDGPYNAEPNTSITITAQPDRGCYFVKWADGNTDNPRTIELRQDTTMEAVFDYLPTGKCGKDTALIWTFDAQTKALEITGAGELTDNYTYTYNAEAVTIGNEITIIGEYAFSGCSQLTSIIIGSSVKVIERGAFNSSYEFASITCYSQRPPTVKQNAFYGNLPYSTIIYVPADYLATYKAHDFWGMFDVRPLGAVTVETNDVKVTPTETTADVVWPAVDNAATYELVIKDKNGNVICTLVFNANGQLTEIAFGAPARDHSTQASGFSFTVTGLEAGTDYDLTITAKDESGAVIETTTQSFTTADVPSAVENVTTGDTRPRKQMINGQLLILRDGKTYTVQGQEVR